jgi:ABC-type glycerol-3-phosphate transport system substrate-binding protein
MKKPRPKKKEAAAPVKAFNKDAPEHKETVIVQKIVKDEALEKRVAMLEGVKAPDVIVNIPPRARISQVAIKYDNFGQPVNLIPQYTEAEV